MSKVSKDLDAVDRKVSGLKQKFERTTKEAVQLKTDLDKAQETISAAENLVGKLHSEHDRWSSQVGELQQELDQLPLRALIAAAFITYMSNAPEDRRQACIKDWVSAVGIDSFELRRFLSTESEQLVWKAEGLPSDELSMENAMMILQVTYTYPVIQDFK